MAGEPVDRLPCWEPLGFEPATLARWHREGLPHDVTLEQFFLWDHVEGVPVSLEAIPPEPGIPLPVPGRDHLRALFSSYCWSAPARYPYRWEALRRYWEGREFALGLGLRFQVSGFGFEGVVKGFGKWLGEWVGEERVRKVGEDELVDEALGFVEEFMRLTLQQAVEDVEPDFALLTDDLCPGGRALTPEEFAPLAPAYERLAGFVRGHGVPHVVLYTPGDVTALVPQLLAAGIDGLMPCAAAAGMDVLALAKAHPELRIIGGMDVWALQREKRDADRETRLKLPPALERGGWIPCFDGPIPPTVPLGNYERYWHVRQDVGCRM